MISPRGKLTYLTSQRAFHGQYRWRHPAPPAAWDLWWAGHSPPAPWSLLQHNISFIHIPASINMNKTQELNISCHHCKELNISCHHCITAEPIKLLGVIWQNDLGWLSHFKSLSPKIIMIRKLRCTVSVEVLVHLYYGYIHSHLSNGTLLWANILFIAQKRQLGCFL